MKCGHEAWEETPFGPGMVSRRCADCREPLDPIAKPAPKPTEFRVGDRVSVEGVIERRVSVHVDQHGPEDPVWECKFQAIEHRPWVRESDLTLIERPRRKLRVGSVWECNGATRYVYLGNDRFYDGLPEPSTFPRDQLTIDTHPQHWREVPVEELAREAT